MTRHILIDSDDMHRGTPIGAAGRGIVAGLAGTLLLSLLSRMMPGMQPKRPAIKREELSGTPGLTLAPALTIPQSPGPEGLAEQLSYKVASGVFGRDLAAHSRLIGRAVHFAYGSAWGMVYGLFQASYPLPPALVGTLTGTVVWSVGPALLGPAMQLIEPPSEESRERNISLVAGHLAYGLGVAYAFHALQRRAH